MRSVHRAYIDCASLRFTAGRSMQVLTTFTYGFRTDNGDPSGECATTLDGVQTSNTATTAISASGITLWGSIPVVDVFSVGAGAHTLGLTCREILPDDHDIVFTDIRITATELAMD